MSQEVQETCHRVQESSLGYVVKKPCKTIGSPYFTIFLLVFFRPGGVFPPHVDYYESEGELTTSKFGNRIALPMIFLNRWAMLVERDAFF